MPNIETFDAPGRSILGQSGGPAALARAAYHSQAEGTSAGQALGGAIQRAGAFVAREANEVAERSETSQAVTRGAAVSAEALAKWQEVAKKADPHDPEVAARFQSEVLQPLLDKSGEGFVTNRGQTVWQNQQARLVDHMTNVMRADMGTMAGDAAKVDFKQQMAFLGGMVVQDPSSLGYAKTTLKEGAKAIADAYPNLTVAQRSALTNTLVEEGSRDIEKSHFGALLAKNTKAAEAMLNSGAYEHLNPGDMAAAIKQAKRADEADARAARIEARQARMERQEQSLMGYLKTVFTGTPEERDGLVKKAVLDPNMGHAGVLTLNNVLEHMERQDAKTDPGIYANVVGRLSLPPEDPNALDTQTLFGMVGKGLSLADAKYLEARVARKDDAPAVRTVNVMMKGALELADSVLNKKDFLTGTRDPIGEQSMLGFQAWFLPTLNTLIPRTLPPEEQLARAQKYLSPTSPDYLLKPENVARFANGQERVDRAIRDLTTRNIPTRTAPDGTPRPPPPGPAQPPARTGAAPLDPQRQQQLDEILGRF